jgi:flagellar motor switch protein FliM
MADESPTSDAGSTPAPAPETAPLAPAEEAAVQAAPEAENPAAKAARVEEPYIKAGGGRGMSSRIEAYDFRNPVFLSELDLRRLRAIHEEFVRYLSARFSLFLRMEFGLTMSQLATQAYVKLTESLPALTHICLFKAEPLVGVGVLDISPRLALAIVDRLLGGKGQAGKPDRPLTEIEVGLLDDLVNILLEEWCRQWKSDQDLRPNIIGHESNGQFLQTSPRDAIILVVTLDATFGDCADQIRIAMPYYTIEPLIKGMQAKRQKEVAVGIQDRKATWQKAYDRIQVPVRAQWDAFEVTLREVTSLRVGDVIEMPNEIFQRTEVLVNGSRKFVGAVGIDDDRVAVQITEKLPPQEDSSHASSD